MKGMTNATKAHLIAIANALVVAVAAAGWIDQGLAESIAGVLNAVAIAWVGVTYKSSAKRAA